MRPHMTVPPRTVVVSNPSGLCHLGKSSVTITRGVTTLASGTLTTGRYRPSLVMRSVLRNFNDPGSSDVAGNLTVSMPRLPPGSELVVANTDVAENLKKLALTVIPASISGAVTTHAVLMNATVGTAFNVETSVLSVFPGSVPLHTSGDMVGKVATGSTAPLRVGLSPLR